MPIYRNRGNTEVAGQALGILCLDEYLPFVPGDVNNASSYNYPVTYKLVPGMHSADVIEGRAHFVETLVAKAQELEREGVRAIISNCGYLVKFQSIVANAVNIPVALSPLTQIPLVASSLGPNKTIGILAAASPPKTREYIESAGINVHNPLAIYGLQDSQGIKEMLAACGIGEEGEAGNDDCMSIDTDKVEADIVDAARELLSANPNTGAIIFECSDFPPYAKAIQDAVGLPVFDALTQADLLFAATTPSNYKGFM